MMRELTIRVLQPLRRVVLWLTYNHALHDVAAARHADLLEQMALLHAKPNSSSLSDLTKNRDFLEYRVMIRYFCNILIVTGQPEAR